LQFQKGRLYGETRTSKLTVHGYFLKKLTVFQYYAQIQIVRLNPSIVSRRSLHRFIIQISRNPSNTCPKRALGTEIRKVSFEVSIKPELAELVYFLLGRCSNIGTKILAGQNRVHQRQIEIGPVYVRQAFNIEFSK